MKARGRDAVHDASRRALPPTFGITPLRWEEGAVPARRVPRRGMPPRPGPLGRKGKTLHAPAQVRASRPSATAFKDVNRRQVGVSKGAAAKAPVLAKSTVAKASAPKAITSSTSPTGTAGGEGDWETF